MARLNFRGVLVKSSLRLGVLVQHRRQRTEVLEEIGVGQMAARKIAQQSRQANKDGDGQYCRPVGGAQIV